MLAISLVLAIVVSIVSAMFTFSGVDMLSMSNMLWMQMVTQLLVFAAPVLITTLIYYRGSQRAYYRLDFSRRSWMAVLTGVAVMMLVVPFYNASAVVLFETFRGGKVDIKDMIKRILTNPIIDGGIAAAIVMLCGIKLPVTIENTVTTLSDCTSPIALILLGAGLNFKDFESDTKKVAICTFGKLVFFPIFGITGAVLMGYRDVPLIAVTLMSSAPVALASFAMASSMGGNGRLAGEIVVTSTLASCLTIPVWLFILKTMGMF